MDVNSKLEEIIRPIVENLGFELVRLNMGSSQSSPTLQVMAERKDGANMQVEDCEKISKAVSPVLDVEDVVKGRYSLEVSSPGIDRPLVKLADFERFKGYEAKVETSSPIDGKKRFTGKIIGVKGGTVTIKADGAEVPIAFADISKAKLVLNDELMKIYLNNSKK